MIKITKILVLLFGLWRLYKLIKKRQTKELKKKFFKCNGGLLLQKQLSTSDGGVQETKVYSSKEMEVATDGFNVNRILGEGGQGTVYKGMLTEVIFPTRKKYIIPFSVIIVAVNYSCYDLFFF